ncbi:MerR family transcriptional regulator [Actinoplanes sp. TBRC 11911]|uniref:MerR family transcriptional regulator n=1 Tax=Actinoplanes sp. TBRC 11911 TaxID=2729386 RepID=UPI00145D78CF|nr:MerR family transcriptional regulator [Actinoplanes sp. TBRC 11911]NMO56914.1 MerR family transcriptional regulator [Actinoplanes sp. TBRC 11911]
MLIGQFAKRVGVSTDTIRFYEKVGFFSGSRGENGYRQYTDRDIETAGLIASGKSLGFSLRDILVFAQEMSGGSLDHARAQASLKDRIQLIDERIASLQQVRKLAEQQLAHCRAVEARELAATSVAPSS